MFDLVHKHKRIAQFILLLIMIPFAFFGVDYYFRSSGGVGEVAKYDGGKITEAEFAQAIRDQQERLRQAGQGVDPAILDNPEVRFNLVQQMLRERLVEKKGADLHFRVANSEVFDRIAADPALSRRRPLLARHLQERAAQRGDHRARIRGQHPPADPGRAHRRPHLARRRRAQGVGGHVREPGGAAARGRIRHHRRRGIREGRHRGCRAGEGVLRRQRGRVQDARGSEIRVRRADAGRAARAGSP